MRLRKFGLVGAQRFALKEKLLFKWTILGSNQ
jgi:hypothetical protein